MAGEEVQYWVPHASEAWLPGKLLREENGAKIFKTEKGEVQLPAKTAPLQPIGGSEELAGVSDVCQLASVSEASLLHTVRVRYFRDEIYTNISRILIGVNPFKPLGIYSNELVEAYHSAKDVSSLPPHIFGVGADAFAGLAAGQRSQAVLIAGESGAGKTESTKYMLLYISEVLKSSEEGLEDKVMQINPVLEAFGNAKTVRNNNSSRFGKWIEVQVNPVAMNLSGASVTDYLLEVTRVCSQGPGERNYHIFYQLASNSSSREMLQLGDPSGFAYLCRNPTTASEIDDAAGFRELTKSLSDLGFTSDEMTGLFQIVAGILHLGNVAFQADDKDDSASVADAAPLARAAEAFGCKLEQLSQCIRFKRIVVGKEVTESPLDCSKAQQARDSVAKLIYGRLFRWLVHRCNEALDAGSSSRVLKDQPFLGVLDIAGFESFDTNLLEQLLINLSNEKLQQFFNATVFKAELTDYSVEGVDLGKVEFNDNADILALIEGKGGLLSLLDDATTGIKQTDEKYVAQAVKAHEKHAHFIKPKFPNEPKFGVRHYPGNVIYTATGFLEKNFSSQPVEVIDLMANSNCPVMQSLAPEPDMENGTAPGSAGSQGKKVNQGPGRKPTVSALFRKSLNNLIVKLSDASAHFVRCVKPNMAKVPQQMDASMVLNQMKLSGVMEAVAIRKAGFPVRQKCADIIRRYSIILPSALRKDLLMEATSTETSTLSKAAVRMMDFLVSMEDAVICKADYTIGKTKIFLKEGAHRNLEESRRLAFSRPVVQIQSVYRGWRERRIASVARRINSELQRCLETMGMRSKENLSQNSVIERLKRATAMEGSLGQLKMLIQRAEQLPIQLPTLDHALRAQARIGAETEVARKMQNAQDSIDVTEMEALLARSLEYNMVGEVVDSLRSRCKRLKEQLPHRHALQRCAVQNLNDVKVTVAAARAVGLDQPAAWLLPMGPAFFGEAVKRLLVLEEEHNASVVAAATRVQCRWRMQKARMTVNMARTLKAEEAEHKRREEERMKKEQEVLLKLAAEKADKEAKALQRVEEERQMKEAEAASQCASEIKACRKNIDAAVAEFDAKALKEALDKAVELGIPQADYADAHLLFMNLQNSEFIQEKINELHRNSSDDMCDLLAVSNLSEQLEALGMKVRTMHDELREVAERMMKRQVVQRKSTGRRSIFLTQDPTELRVAERCFTDLAHFSGLRDPNTWGRAVHRNCYQEDAVRAMLRHSIESIPEPLTKLHHTSDIAAVRMFGNLLRCMGDKPAAYVSDKQRPIIEGAKRTPDLCDEIYVQIMKQLTGNPSAESATKGWQLLTAICHEVLPCAELCEFLRAFLQNGAKEPPKKVPDPVPDPVPAVESQSHRHRPRRGGVRAAKVRFSISDSSGGTWSAEWEDQRAAFTQKKPVLAAEALQAFLYSMGE